jgi:hypothetical protein
MRFENPPALPHDESEGILSRALSQRPAPRDAVNALVGMALGDDDAGFVERWCMRIADEAVDPALKGLAALCIGHVARRFGEVTLEAATTVVRLFADAEVMAANPQPLDALDDLDNFATGDSGGRQAADACRAWRAAARLVSVPVLRVPDTHRAAAGDFRYLSGLFLGGRQRPIQRP